MSQEEVDTQVQVKVKTEAFYFKADMDVDKDLLKFKTMDIIRALLSAFTFGLASTGFSRLSLAYILYSIPGFIVIVCMIVGIAIEKTILGVVIVIFLIHVLNCASYSYRLLVLQRLMPDRAILFKIKQKLKADHEKTAEIPISVIYSIKKLKRSQLHNPNFKWKLLSDEYQDNLANFWKTYVDKSDKITHGMVVQALKEACEINAKTNGFDLFYILTVKNKKTQKLIYGLMVACILSAIILLVFAEINMTRLISDNFFGVSVRIALIQVVFSMTVICAMSVFSNPIQALSVIRKSSTWINIGGLYRGSRSDEFILNVFDIHTLECFYQNYLCLRRSFLVTTKPYEKPIIFLVFAGIIASAFSIGSIQLSWDNTVFFGNQFISVLMIVVDIPLFLLLMSYMGFGILFNQNQDKVISALGTIKATVKELKELKEHTYLTESDRSDRQNFLLSIIERDKVDLEVLHKRVEKMIKELTNIGKGEVYKFLGIVECSMATVTQIRVALTSLAYASVVKFINIINQYW